MLEEWFAGRWVKVAGSGRAAGAPHVDDLLQEIGRDPHRDLLGLAVTAQRPPPLTVWSKLPMMLQFLASPVTVAVVISRAVNILS